MPVARHVSSPLTYRTPTTCVAWPTQTQGTAAFESDLIEGLGRTTALNRTAEADEIANVVTFVASPAASYVNGAILTVGGGAQAIKPAA